MKNLKFLLIIFLLLFSFCQKVEIENISGCTEPDAANYNPDANVNRNTCEYGAYVKIKFTQDLINSFTEDSIYIRYTFKNNTGDVAVKYFKTPKDTFEVNTIFVNFGSQKRANVDFAIHDFYKKYAGTKYFLLENKKQIEIIF